MLPVVYILFAEAGMTTDSRDPPFTNSRCVYMHMARIRVAYTSYMNINIYIYTPRKHTFLNTENLACIVISYGFFFLSLSLPFVFLFFPMFALTSGFSPLPSECWDYRYALTSFLFQCREKSPVHVALITLPSLESLEAHDLSCSS